MNYRFTLIAVFFICLGIAPLHSQQSEWIEYPTIGNIRAIAEEGNALWFATWTGLVKFDKKTFTTEQYTLMNTGLQSLNIPSIAVDGNGVKWMGTSFGLVRFDGTDWTIYNTTNSPLTSQAISAISTDPDNTIWVATWNELASLKDGIWTLYDSKQYPCFAGLTTLHATADGTLWATSESCLNAYRLDLNDGVLKPVYEELLGRRVTGITSSGGTTVFATYGKPDFSDNYGNLISFKTTEMQIHTWKSMGFTGRLMNACIDSAGGIWAVFHPGNENLPGGVSHFDGTSWTIFDAGEELPIAPNTQLQIIMTDSDGIVWSALPNNGGLLRYDGNTWKHIPVVGMCPAAVSSIIVDTDMSVWTAHENQPYLTRFNGSNIRTIETPSEVRQLAIDGNGTKWVVAMNGELFRSSAAGWEKADTAFVSAILYIDRSNTLWGLTLNWKNSVQPLLQRFDGTHWKDIEGLPNRSTFGSCSAATQDRNGIWWFGTTNGLWKYNGTEWTLYPRDWQPLDNFDHDGLVMTCDSANNIWVGVGNNNTIDNGLSRFNGNAWERFTGAYADAPFVYINSLATDKTGNVWVGGLYLQKFDGTAWTVFNPENSPVASSPYSMAVAPDNTLWMSNAGLLGYREGGILVSAPNAITIGTTPAIANYPNPTSSLTTIRYSVTGTSAHHVLVKIYNALGDEVATITNRVHTPGEYAVEFDVSALPAGTYYYQVTTAGTTASKHMVVVK